MNALTYFVSNPHVGVVSGLKYIRALIKLHYVGHDFKVGDIFCQRSGFEHNYYQAVSLEGRTGIGLRWIAMFIRPTDEYAGEWKPNVIPARDHFKGEECPHVVKIGSVRQDFKPTIEARIGTFIKVSGDAIIHPFVPGFPFELEIDAVIRKSRGHKRYPGLLEPVIASPSICIVTRHFDALIEAHKRERGSQS